MKILRRAVSFAQSFFSRSSIRKGRLWVIRLKAARKSIYIGLLLIAGLLQITLLDSFKFCNVKPDLILIMAILASFIFGFREAILLSFIAGALKDALGAQAFGINSLLFPLWSFLLAQLNRQISIDHELFRIIIMAVVTLLHNILTGLSLVHSGSVIPTGIFLRIVLLETVYTTLAAMLIFKGQERFFQHAETLV